nr:MAG TPA: hypothetical protein [Caudoviricetes sp.]
MGIAFEIWSYLTFSDGSVSIIVIERLVCRVCSF